MLSVSQQAPLSILDPVNTNSCLTKKLDLRQSKNDFGGHQIWSDLSWGPTARRLLYLVAPSFRMKMKRLHIHKKRLKNYESRWIGFSIVVTGVLAAISVKDNYQSRFTLGKENREYPPKQMWEFATVIDTKEIKSFCVFLAFECAFMQIHSSSGSLGLRVLINSKFGLFYSRHTD